ncbi:MAG: linear amide C-N hydrolase [Clostridia bacterium]|nr:linear amide C-N hydrolase [Clostridia bacterium]
MNVTKKIYYYNTYENLDIKTVVLKEESLDLKELITKEM